MGIDEKRFLNNWLMIMFNHSTINRYPPADIHRIGEDAFQPVSEQFIVALLCDASFPVETEPADTLEVYPTFKFRENKRHFFYFPTELGEIPVKFQKSLKQPGHNLRMGAVNDIFLALGVCP